MLFSGRYKIQVFLLSGLLFILPSLLSGQTVTPDSALQNILHNLEGKPLSLSGALELSNMNSTSVGKSNALYYAALGSLRRERGVFDPELYFNLNYEDIKEPTASFFSGADVLITERTTSQTGLRLKLPVGTQLELSLNTINLKSNSQFAFLNPEYNAFGSLTLRQPLLGGFLASGREELTNAELQLDAAKFRYDQEVLIVNSEVEKAYWQLYSAERDYGVQKLVYDRAKEFLRLTELREKAGLVGPNQVASAKTFLAEQEFILIDQEEALDRYSDQLVVLIGLRPDENYIRYKTVDTPPVKFPVEPVDEVIELALANNLELQARRKELDLANSSLDAAAWEVFPQLDLVGSLVSSGIGGDSQNIIFGGDTLRTTAGGSFGDMLSQILQRKFPGWSVGIELSVPIGFRSGLGEKDRLEAEVSFAEQHYIELSRNLEQLVRNAHRELSHGNMRLKAAIFGVEAAQDQVRIGLIEFQSGRITAFELVRLGEDFAKAQRRYSEALVRTVSAVAMLKQLTSGRYSVNANFN